MSDYPTQAMKDLFNDAARAEELFSLDELEQFAEQWRRKQMTEDKLVHELKVGDAVVITGSEHSGKTGVVVKFLPRPNCYDVRLHGREDKVIFSAQDIEPFEDEIKSFKVGVITQGDKTWVTNSLRFKTEAAASQYGDNLFYRWTAVKRWCVLASSYEPTEET